MPNLASARSALTVAFPVLARKGYYQHRIAINDIAPSDYLYCTRYHNKKLVCLQIITQPLRSLEKQQLSFNLRQVLETKR